MYEVKATQGQTITLDNNVRHKRHDLLKVPQDTEDLEDNIITKTKKENTQEVRKVKISSHAFKEKLKSFQDRKKKERANLKRRKREKQKKRRSGMIRKQRIKRLKNKKEK